MKKFLITSALALVFAFSALAQSNAQYTIKGDMDIRFNSRTTKGAKDVYTVKVNVANSALFQGTITDTPQIIDGWMSKKVTQARSLNYDINCDVVNPKNPAQTKNVGRLYGKVGIDPDGTYRYDAGSLTASRPPCQLDGDLEMQHCQYHSQRQWQDHDCRPQKV
jgi:opacity protein-like surface antigen